MCKNLLNFKKIIKKFLKLYILLLQSCTQIMRPLARFYSYDYDLRKTNNILK